MTLLGSLDPGGLCIIGVIFLMLRSPKLIPMSVIKRGADFSRLCVVNNVGRPQFSESALQPRQAMQIPYSLLAECVSKVREEGGIRYLLRISSDKAVFGVVTGRNTDGFSLHH